MQHIFVGIQFLKEAASLKKGLGLKLYKCLLVLDLKLYKSLLVLRQLGAVPWNLFRFQNEGFERQNWSQTALGTH